MEKEGPPHPGIERKKLTKSPGIHIVIMPIAGPPVGLEGWTAFKAYTK